MSIAAAEGGIAAEGGAAARTAGPRSVTAAEGGIAAGVQGKTVRGGAGSPAPAAQAPAGGGGGPGKKPGKKGAPAGAGARRAVRWAWSDNRKLLVAQFIVCLVVLGAGTVVSPQGSKHDVTRAMIKGSALAGVFFVLALVSTAGSGAARTANAVGTLITATYVLTSADVHNVVAWVGGFFQPASAGEVVGEGLGGDGSNGPPAGGTQQLGVTEV